MPRKARILSYSGIYHVMMRGVNRQQIFKDSEDNRYFIKQLGRYKEISEYILHAYCLMGNHFHLLIQTKDEPLKIIIRRIGDSYVYWYNIKYNRCGHLFQDRFKSEPVEDDAYYLTVLRYILRNPVSAGICADPYEYEYSSISDYANIRNQGITDTSFTFKLMDSSKLYDYLMQDEKTECLDMPDVRQRLSDNALLEKLKEYPLDPAVSKPAVKIKNTRYLIEAGASIRQLSRLSGVSKSQIQRYLKL